MTFWVISSILSPFWKKNFSKRKNAPLLHLEPILPFKVNHFSETSNKIFARTASS